MAQLKKCTFILPLPIGDSTKCNGRNRNIKRHLHVTVIHTWLGNQRFAHPVALQT